MSDQLSYYSNLAIEIILVLLGHYFGYLSFKTGWLGEYSAKKSAKASLLFSICLMLITLGFMLIIMTTDGTQISEFLAMYIILELIFGILVFLLALIGQWLIARSMGLFIKKG